METDLPLEVIGGYKVHPAASLFPLIEGEDFEDLVFSIKTMGVIQPIIISNGVLIDGRNRLRAVTRLRKEGCTLALPTKELDLSVESVSLFIFDSNVHRRNLTPAQIVAITSDVWPMIAEEKKAKQEATQFKPGNKAGPDGRKGKEPVDTVSHPPVPKDIKAKNEQSTVGKIAKLAGVSHHKARQMVAVNKAVEAGELPKDTKAKIISGEVKLKDVAPKPIAKPVPATASEIVSEYPPTKKDLAYRKIIKAIDSYLAIDGRWQLLKVQIDSYFDMKKKESR